LDLQSWSRVEAVQRSSLAVVMVVMVVVVVVVVVSLGSSK